MMGSVFAMQGIGQFVAAMVALVVTSGFKESLLSAKTAAACDGVCQLAVDKMWRVIIGFGAVPGCIALYYRLTIPETPRYTFDVARDVEKAGEDTKAYIQGRPEGHPDEIRRVATIQDSVGRLEIPKASWSDFFRHYSQWRHGKVLLGTAGSWFTLDVAYYGLGLNNSIILTAIGFAKGNTMYKIFYNTAVGNLIIVCAGAIPGYWFTVAFVDTVGRKPIQFMGFTMLTIIFICIGFAYDTLLKHNGALLALYVLAQFFFNFGKSLLVLDRSERPVSRFGTQRQSSLGTIQAFPSPVRLTVRRPQCNHFHRAGRMFPDSLPLHVARPLGRVGQGWRHHCANHFRSAADARRSSGRHRQRRLPMAQTRDADIRALHAVRPRHHRTHPGDKA